MLNNPNARQWLQHLIAVAVFLTVTLLYFSPLLEGKKIKQYDIANWQGMSKEISDYREKHHSEPLWTNSMFGGMPSYQISVLYKANLIQYIDKIIMRGLPGASGYAFLFFVGFYFLLITLGVDKRVAVFGALAFGFSSYFFIFIETVHTSKLHAIGYMAAVMAGVIMCYRKNILIGAFVFFFFKQKTAYEIIEEELYGEAHGPAKSKSIPKPQEIYQTLCQYVIGQDR